MADIKVLRDKLAELYAILYDEQDQINILNEHYHLVSLAKDEVLRQIQVLESGEKSTEPPSLAEVTASVMAKKVAVEPTPIKEVIEEPVIK